MATAVRIVGGRLEACQRIYSSPARRDRIGSLLLAGRGPDGRLTLVGQVASGFSDVERRRLYALLVKIPRARPQVAHEKQIRGVHWVDPVYTGEVAFREYVPGRGLRHPSWKGLRDNAADTVGMPPAVDSGDGVSATPED